MDQQNRRGRVKRSLMFAGWIVGSLQALILAVLVIGTVTINEHDWSVFFNAQLSLAWFRLTVVFFALFLFDAATPGRTLSTILECDRPDSTARDRQTAAFFLAAVLLAVVMAISGHVY